MMRRKNIGMIQMAGAMSLAAACMSGFGTGLHHYPRPRPIDPLDPEIDKKINQAREVAETERIEKAKAKQLRKQAAREAQRQASLQTKA